MSDQIKSNEPERFAQVSNRAIRDEELGAVALAIYTYIRSHSAQNFKIYKRNVESRFKEIGRVSFNRAWKSLIEKGWLASHRMKDEQGRYTKWEHIVLVEHEGYRLDSKGKSMRVTEMHPDDFRLDDSHDGDTLNNTNVNNTKNKNKHTSTEIDESTDAKVTKLEQIPFDDILRAYNEHLPALSQPKKLTDKRKTAIRRCWKDDKKHRDINFWKTYFNYISKSAFLTGQVKKWKADFDFIIKLDNLIKITEGTYHIEHANQG
jgi:hypothetical protein